MAAAAFLPTMLAVLAMLATWSLPGPAAAQGLADLGVSLRTVFPSTVSVGQTGVPASLVIESTGLLPVVVTAISVDAGCTEPPAGGECAPSGAVGLAPTATGTGNACNGTTFAVTGPEPGGRQLLVPSFPVILFPLANLLPSCTVNLTFDVIRAGPHPQLHPSATVSGFAIPTLTGHVSAASAMTVSRATTDLVTTGVIGPVALGTPIRAVVTVIPRSVAPGAPAPTGSIAFSLFGSADTACQGRPLIGPVEQPLVDGGASAPPFTPTFAGTFRWSAQFSGDANYHAAVATCVAATTVSFGPTTTSAPPTSASSLPSPSPVTAPPPSIPSPSAPGQTVTPTTRVAAPTVMGRYDPAANAEEVVALGVSAFALLTLLGSSGASGGSGVAPRSATVAEPSAQGEVVFSEVESAEEGLAVGAEGEGPGDRSWTWRWAGTPAFDRLSSELPAQMAPRSPLVARVLNDAGYLRAMLGSASIVAPVLGILFGVLAVRDVQGEALPPHFGLAVALAVIGVFDALAGLLAVTVFVAGVVILGGVSSADAVRTLLGLSTLWFAAPLIAGTARPLRRPRTETPLEHWDRTADIVIASLVGAWAVQKILQGLPGLSGLELTIAEQANEVALIVLGALVLRMVIETVATHWYPARLNRVQPAELGEPGVGQRVAANFLILAIFLFVAVSYLGSCWQLYVGAALFILPKFLQLAGDRFPTSPRIYAITPRGIVELVAMLVIGAVIGALVLAWFGEDREALRNGFVLLALPSLGLALLELFGGEGPDRELTWARELLGIPVLVLGVLLVLGLVGI